MKLKMLLLAVFAAGFAASLAFAGDGKKSGHANSGCSETHLAGTIAPQSVVLTVDKAGSSSVTPGSQVTLALGGAGQTVRVNVEACATGTTLTVRQLELRVRTAPTQTGTPATTTTHHGGDDHGDRHKGGTTTVSTTTTATTTTP
jgi:hypothetical protein